MFDWLAIFLVILGTLCGAIGALLIKKSLDLNLPWFKFWKSKQLLCGLLIYFCSVIFYIIALKREELSVVYPLVSLSYLWITLLSVKFLGEKMNFWKSLALVGIIVGVILIGIGS